MEEIKMKDSGIKWIGQIPEDWDIKKIKYKAKLYTGNSIADNEKENYEDSDFALPYIATKDINVHNHNIDYENGMYIKKDDWSFKRAPKDSSLLCIEGGSAGKKIGYTNQPVCFVNKLCCFTSDNMDNKFLFYTLNSYSFKEAFNQNIFGLIGGVSTEKIKNIKITIPSIEEQKLIAEFLDKKCSDIDEIISKTEKQIETLEQYKKSLVTETITKGLKSNVEYINVYNSWYRTKPKNWKLCRIKEILDCLTDYTANGSFQSLADNVEYLDYEDYARVIRLTDLRVNMENAGIYVNEHAYKYLRKSSLFGGEILVANVGAYAGIFCEMPKCNYKATLGPNMFLLKTNKLMLQHYLYYIGLSDIVSEQLIIKSTASAQPKLNKQDVKSIYILVPPIYEQKEIAAFLDMKCEKTDKIIKQQKESLETLKKYKQSLIYEYVTGKKRV